jgi:hypothetical protein
VRRDAYQQAAIAVMSAEDRAGLVHYISKAIGWLLVGLGGLLLAINETWLLRERYDWPVAVFCVVVVAAAGLSTGYSAYTFARNREFLG